MCSIDPKCRIMNISFYLNCLFSLLLLTSLIKSFATKDQELVTGINNIFKQHTLNTWVIYALLSICVYRFHTHYRMIIERTPEINLRIEFDKNRRKERKKSACTCNPSAISFLVFSPLFRVAVVHRSEYDRSIARIHFLMTWAFCVPESWNGEGLCRTHESQRAIAVNCVRTRVLCHRKFRFCAGDWFYKKAKESTSVQRGSGIANCDSSTSPWLNEIMTFAMISIPSRWDRVR